MQGIAALTAIFTIVALTPWALKRLGLFDIIFPDPSIIGAPTTGSIFYRAKWWRAYNRKGRRPTFLDNCDMLLRDILEQRRRAQHRRRAEALRKASDPEEIRTRERHARVATIEAEFAAIKPVQPPPKSKRLSEAKRVARETNWFSENAMGFTFVMAIAPMLFGAVGQGGVISPPAAIFLFLVIIVGLVVGVRAHHYSDAHQRYLRAKSRDEDKKWAEEDAAWREYEAVLKQWEQNKQERLLTLDALKTDSDGVTNIGRKVINELNL